MTFPTRTRNPSRAFAPRRGTLMDYLGAADAYARLSGQAERLRQLQALLDAALPPHLGPGTRIANLKRGKVIIHADSGAVAVKLRQLAPRLTAGFIQQGQEVTGIEVRVQAGRLNMTETKRKAGKTLGLRPKQALTSLAAGLTEDSPIKRALQKLLRNT